ncbi:SCO family protein [Dyadobacter luteus]|uniref:SCO family protein n=1 Tax=Dyadobacter luteus TaxID=2259619 RepID=A0A3D8Y9P8_9BACT|nr:SCO family protein [Dyadobacter luteus]REA60138.1 SCO family protein [Dyadobacter luteus]
MKHSHISIASLFLILAFGCQNKKLPILGESETINKLVDGKTVEQIIYPVIPDFSFLNQNGKVVTQSDYKDKIYIADFFFTTCPTICPVMKKNMLLVYEQFKDDQRVGILSHTIDPEHDTPQVLKQYSDDLGLSGNMWTFVTGDREKIFDIGQKHYMVSASTDPDEPGGYIHSGSFVLVDKDKHVRGMYDGTSQASTKELIKDIQTLLEE